MDGTQVVALLVLLGFITLLVHAAMAEKHQKEIQAEQSRNRSRLANLDDIHRLEAMWHDTFDDPDSRAEYEAHLDDWYGRNYWALGLTLEEAAWVIRQGRENEEPQHWRDEIGARRQAEDDVAMFLTTDERTVMTEGRVQPHDWEELQGWGDDHRVTPEEVAALQHQHGVVRTHDVMAVLRERFNAGDST